MTCPHRRYTITSRTATKRCKHAPGGYKQVPVFKCRDCGVEFTADKLNKEKSS